MQTESNCVCVIRYSAAVDDGLAKLVKALKKAKAGTILKDTADGQ